MFCGVHPHCVCKEIGVPSRVKIPLSRTLHFVLLHSRLKIKKKDYMSSLMWAIDFRFLATDNEIKVL